MSGNKTFCVIVASLAATLGFAAYQSHGPLMGIIMAGAWLGGGAAELLREKILQRPRR